MDVQTSVAREADVDLQQQIGVTTDGLTMTAAGALFDVPIPAKHIAFASFGIYDVQDVGGQAGCPALGRLELPGWKRMVRVQDDDGEEVLVYVPEGDQPLWAMAVIVREEEEMVIAKLIGRIDKLVEEMIANEGWSPLAFEATPADPPPAVPQKTEAVTSCCEIR
jgi:hypothetical protein